MCVHVCVSYVVHISVFIGCVECLRVCMCVYMNGCVWIYICVCVLCVCVYLCECVCVCVDVGMYRLCLSISPSDS